VSDLFQALDGAWRHSKGGTSIMKKLAAIAILGLWGGAAHAQSSCVGVPLVVPLVASGTILAGTVTVTNDAVNLFVTFTTTGDWTIGKADVAVATSLSGLQSDPSQFPYHRSFCPEVTTTTFTIPLPLTPGTTCTTVFIAAHASLDSPTQGHAEAWGGGQLIPGSKACQPACDCDDDGDGGHDGGDHAGRRLNWGGGGDGGGDHHCGDHGDHHSGSIQDDGGDHCKHGDHGDRHSAVIHHDGGNQCGGGGHGDHHGAMVHDGGGDGGGEGDHDDDEGGQNCGATYFVFCVTCAIHE
jgi:hypothetical protein